MTADTDLDELRAGMQKTPREAFAELEAARRAAEARTPERTIIPEPELPPLWPHPGSGIVRFPCPLGCGWAHEEDAYALDVEPISVPLHSSPAEISRIFAERSERGSRALQRRIGSAVREHFVQAHHGQEPPEREVW
ncbi:hypothetical protein GTY54_34510 [Streptomyces sp. SID625]|nr:hypothetical protein [Streptomyces sp. SID625]